MKGAWRICSIVVGLGCLVACEDPAEMSGPDAGVEPRCNPTAKFRRRIEFRSFSSSANEEQAALSPDELTIYFSRDGGSGSYDIYQATRTSKTASFGAAVPVPGVNTAGEEREPRLTADGLSMFGTIRATPNDKFHVAFATRASKDADFGPLQPVPTINGTANDSDPFISADGRTLYFSSDRGGNYALYRSSQTGGVFSPPELVPGSQLDTAYLEGAPVLSDNELTMYFGSARASAGSVDIYQATRASVQAAFGEPIAVEELNGPEPELPSWISADGCELYFTRFDLAVGFDLAVAFRGR